LRKRIKLKRIRSKIATAEKKNGWVQIHGKQLKAKMLAAGEKKHFGCTATHPLKLLVKTTASCGDSFRKVPSKQWK
jgi:hypothetical protein